MAVLENDYAAYIQTADGEVPLCDLDAQEKIDSLSEDINNYNASNELPKDKMRPNTHEKINGLEITPNSKDLSFTVNGTSEDVMPIQFYLNTTEIPTCIELNKSKKIFAYSNIENSGVDFRINLYYEDGSMERYATLPFNKWQDITIPSANKGKKVVGIAFYIRVGTGVTISDGLFSLYYGKSYTQLGLEELIEKNQNDIAGLNEKVNNFANKNEIYKICQKVGVIGDSNSSVRIYYVDYLGATQTLGDVEEYSWGKCIERTNQGLEYKIFAKGGLECSQWLNDEEKGYPVASLEENLCPVYIMYLGINDSSRHDVSYIGSIDDIKENPDDNSNTFIGNYAKIIQKMRIKVKQCRFFVITMPNYYTENNKTRYEQYNQAIRDISNYFDNVYLIDLYAKYHDLFSEKGGFFETNTVNSHYTPLAYQHMSKLISREMSEIIFNNPDDFKYVQFIGTDIANKIWK